MYLKLKNINIIFGTTERHLLSLSGLQHTGALGGEERDLSRDRSRVWNNFSKLVQLQAIVKFGNLAHIDQK